MQGYAVLAEEAIAQSDAQPTHLFLQGGVGGFAAAIIAHYWERTGAARPTTIIVEPDRAACLLASARAGKPEAVHGALDTIMAGLACGEPSLLAWDILDAGADAFLSIPDERALEAMRTLRIPRLATPPLSAVNPAWRASPACRRSRMTPPCARRSG